MFVIFGVPARVGVLVKSGLVRTGGGPSGCAKEVPIINIVLSSEPVPTNVYKGS